MREHVSSLSRRDDVTSQALDDDSIRLTSMGPLVHSYGQLL